jgi:hypothetical protein
VVVTAIRAFLFIVTAAARFMLSIVVVAFIAVLI